MSATRTGCLVSTPRFLRATRASWTSRRIRPTDSHREHTTKKSDGPEPRAPSLEPGCSGPFLFSSAPQQRSILAVLDVYATAGILTAWLALSELGTLLLFRRSPRLWSMPGFPARRDDLCLHRGIRSHAVE